MSAINVNSITGRTGTHGPVLTGVTTATNGLNVTAGNVGIGTDDPTDHLQILHTNGKGLTFKTTEDHYAQITSDVNRTSGDSFLLALEGKWNGTPVSEIALVTGSDTTNKDDGEIIFRTSSANNLNSSERLRILSSGDVGIGTISVPTNFKVEISNNGATGLNIRNTNDSASDSCRIAFSQGSGNLTSSNTFGDIISVADAVSPLSGHIKFRTNVGNNLTEKLRILSSGGITFNGDTAAANALDDYEEGTWTPTYRGSSTAGSFTYADNIGVYTKIGRSVFVTIRLTNITEVSAASGNVQILGLPFAADASMTGGNMRLDLFNVSSNVYQIAFQLSASSSSLAIYQSQDNTGDAALTVGARTSNSSDIVGSFTYNTTT